MLISPWLRNCLLAMMWGLTVIPVSAEGPTKAKPTKAVGLLVLKSGRFVDGKISQSAGGYVVEKPNGRMVVPFKLVDFPAIDRQDAYLIMRNRLKSPTPTGRMALARWCLTHSMYKETEAELRTVLKISPERTDARQMLERLERVLYSNRSRRRTTPPRSPSRTTDGFTRTEATALSGLKPKPAREFVSTIQPILMNKCGNARCHGSAARNRFRLTRVRTGFGSHRVFVERNLASVLREIDGKQPSKSKLLTVPQKGHGRGGRTIFFGRSGARQYQLLRTWTLAVASTRLPSSTGDPVSSKTSDAAANPPPKTIPHPPGNDPFDPNVFNRTVHKKPGRNKAGQARRLNAR